jgi:hypothetical protein
MINCFNINLNANPFKQGIEVSSYGTDRYIRKLSVDDDINPDLISVLASLNLTISWAELFYTAPFTFSGPHIDDIQGGDFTKLNYVFGGKNSFMYWWKPKPGVSKPLSKTEIDSHYIRYNIHEVDLIDKQRVQFPSIVQVGVPHNIHNFEEPRYCLSIVLRKSDNTRLTMSEAIEIFDEYKQ